MPGCYKVKVCKIDEVKDISEKAEEGESEEHLEEEENVCGSELVGVGEGFVGKDHGGGNDNVKRADGEGDEDSATDLGVGWRLGISGGLFVQKTDAEGGVAHGVGVFGRRRRRGGHGGGLRRRQGGGECGMGDAVSVRNEV